MMLKSMGMGIVELFALMNCVAGKQQVSLFKTTWVFGAIGMRHFLHTPKKRSTPFFETRYKRSVHVFFLNPDLVGIAKVFLSFLLRCVLFGRMGGPFCVDTVDGSNPAPLGIYKTL